ncbi:hypothetical protein VSDG_09149 [Cytospora chrysosperma]|uniref:Uncharacterized protein n=1 Tax=Cytospora chrysosperma TaxID=252740 RepID=A0A423VCD4_CYTCH|nr:hypothetical protein VSDG_09149 [Valsa sordida]
MTRTWSSLAPELSSADSSGPSHAQDRPAKRVRLEAPRNKYPSIDWLTESWLAKVVSYERIATASPRLGVGIIGQGLLDHHINLLPNITGLQDFTPVRDSDGDQAGYRAKVVTWPMTKKDALKVREFAA